MRICSGALVSASSTLSERLTPGVSLVRPPIAANVTNRAAKMHATPSEQDHDAHISTFETLDIQTTPTASRMAMPARSAYPIGVVKSGLT